MKIKGTIGQYPIDLEIEGDIDYSKINKLISHISEDHAHKQQGQSNRVPGTLLSVPFLSSPTNILRSSTYLFLGSNGILK